MHKIKTFNQFINEKYENDLDISDFDEWDVIEWWASWKKNSTKYNTSYGQIVSDLGDIPAFLNGDVSEDDIKHWKDRYNLLNLDTETIKKFDKEIWDYLLSKAKEENAFEEYKEYVNQDNKQKNADIPENYYYDGTIKGHAGASKYVFKHKRTGNVLKLDDYGIGDITSRMYKISKEQALKNYFKNK